MAQGIFIDDSKELLEKTMEYFISVAKKDYGKHPGALGRFFYATGVFGLTDVVDNHFDKSISRHLNEDEISEFQKEKGSILDKIKASLTEIVPDYEDRNGYLNWLSKYPELMLEEVKTRVMYDLDQANEYLAFTEKPEIKIGDDFIGLTSYQEISDYLDRFFEENELEPIGLRDLRRTNSKGEEIHLCKVHNEGEKHSGDIEIYSAIQRLTRENTVEEYLRDVIRYCLHDAFYAVGIKVDTKISEERKLSITMCTSMRDSLGVLIDYHLIGKKK